MSRSLSAAQFDLFEACNVRFPNDIPYFDMFAGENVLKIEQIVDTQPGPLRPTTCQIKPAAVTQEKVN